MSVQLMKPALACLCLVASVPVLASNPFMPSSSVDRAAIEKIIDERFRQLEQRLVGSVPMDPSVAAAPPVGGPGIPGDPSVGALPTLASAPNPIAATSDVKFAGCIDGRHVFRDSQGGRVVVSPQLVAEAVESRVIPRCR